MCDVNKAFPSTMFNTTYTYVDRLDKIFSSEQNFIGVGDEGGHVPPKLGKNIFWTIVMSNLGIFGQKSCKIREFC